VGGLRTHACSSCPVRRVALPVSLLSVARLVERAFLFFRLHHRVRPALALFPLHPSLTMSHTTPATFLVWAIVSTLVRLARAPDPGSRR
jgi:hypothetical protein